MIQLKKKISAMIDKTWMWSGKNVAIQNIIHVSSDMYQVISAEGDYKVSEDELMNDFLPVHNEQEIELRSTVADIVKRESDQMQSLSAILMGNIEKIQNEPKFIEQARAINESAKSLIEIKKTQVEMFKLLKP